MHERKQRVLLSAQKLFVTKGFNNTSIQDILEEANISKGTFYNYFSSKNECLIAILETAQNDTIARRAKLQNHHHPSDKHVLEKQISVRFEVMHEHHLLPLFEQIRHSDDQELKEFVKHYHFQEIKWLSSRLIDVYGTEVKHYAYDCAVLLLGIIQQLFHIWGTYTDKNIHPAALISYAMRRIDKVIVDLIETNDILFGDKWCEKAVQKNVPSKQQIAKELMSLACGNNEKAKEYVEFIIEELKADKPKKHILHSVLLALRQEILDSQLEIDSLAVLTKVEQVIERI